MTTADDTTPTDTVAAAKSSPIDADHRYQLLIDSIADHAFYLLDSDGRVTSWNSGAERIKGYSAAEILGRDFSCFFTAEDRAAGRPRETLRHAAESGVFREEAMRVRKDGSSFWAQITVHALRDLHGKLFGFSKLTLDITERRSSDAQRRMATAVLDYSPDSIIVMNRSGQIERVNDRAVAMFGYPREKLLGSRIELLLPERFHQRHVAHRDGYFAKPTRREMGSNLELSARRADGTEFPVDVMLGPLTLDTGDFAIAIVRDITERRALEAPSRVAAAILDYSPDSIILMNDHGLIERANDSAVAMFGYPREKLVGSHVELLLPERFHDRHVAHRDGFFVKPTRREMGTGRALYARRADGSEFPVDVMLGPVQLDTGNFAIAIVRDITERRALEAPSRVAAAILDYSPDSIVLMNGNGVIERANDSAIAMFGYPREKLVGSHVELLLPERFHDRHVAHRDGFFAKPTRREMGSGRALYARRADGSEFPVDVMLGPVQLDTGAFAIAIVRDITERKAAADALTRSQREQAIAEERARAGDALRRTSEALEKIVQASPLAIIALDSADQVAIWNATAERMFETAGADVLGRQRSELWSELHPKGAADPAALRDAVTKEHSVRNLEGSLRRSDGTLLDLNISIASLGGGVDRTDGFLFMIDDVTQQRATEEHLRQAQKMEAIGQLTGGIAHDFNNLLAIIYGNLELIVEQAETPQMRELTADALKAAERGASLTHRLLAYARQQQLAPTLVDIEKLIRDLIVVLRRTIEESVRIETDVAPDLWPARIDAHQLENALINLAVNARDAMPQGGRLSVTAENAVLDEEYAVQVLDLAPGEYVMVSVSDTGTGMPKHVAERALEPFFTTKAVGRGTGLGLSMVYGFIKQSGGHLKIYSEMGHGTSVKLFLPRASTDGSAWRASRARDAAPISMENRLVLVVEDEEAVRRLQVKFLKSLGYRTIEAEDGVIGLAALEANPDIDLILTDVVLPNGISGVDLATAVLKKRPGTKFIFMSGYSRHAMTMPPELRDIPILSKPFARASLAETVVKVFAPGKVP